MYINYFKHIGQKTNGEEIQLDYFLEDIKNGRWTNEIISHRQGERVSFPYVTISGTFTERAIAGLKEHSGFICIDVDDVDPNEVKAQVCADKYTYAAFTSRSGRGVAIIYKINPKKHRESFEGLSEYLFDNYQIVVDQSGKDISRARFVSYDPDIYINVAAAKFAIYPKPKPKALTKLPKTIYVQSDFDEIINEIVSRGIDIVPNYSEWLQVSFALCDKFGEYGRQYFHAISQVGGDKYAPDKCNKQYNACLAAGKSGITIATFYWYCKQAGISTISEKTKLISVTASQARKGGRNIPDTIKLLQDIENIPAIDSADIIQQVFDNKIEVESGDGIISELEIWLRQNYEMRRNELTRRIENNEKTMEARDFNTVFIHAKKIFETLNYEIMDRLINSDFVMDYNPLIDFFEHHKDRQPAGAIKALCETINSTMPKEYIELFVTKWLCGVVQSAVDKESSPLMLVLAGNVHNTGKTEWFRRLLPREIRQYYAESKLDAGKDDEILMTQKLVIMDDEMSGKSKTDAAKMKYLTSKKWFSLREPYGRGNVDLRRLAMLCGTSNENTLLNDPTGNRRILPIHVLSINHDLYNSIDKTDVFIEAYHLLRSGYTPDLVKDEIAFLADHTLDFHAISVEQELIQKFFEAPEGEEYIGTDFMTTSEIKSYIEQRTGQRLNLNKIGHEMRNLGFETSNGYTKSKIRRKGYNLIIKSNP